MLSRVAGDLGQGRAEGQLHVVDAGRDGDDGEAVPEGDRGVVRGGAEGGRAPVDVGPPAGEDEGAEGHLGRGGARDLDLRRRPVRGVPDLAHLDVLGSIGHTRPAIQPPAG